VKISNQEVVAIAVAADVVEKLWNGNLQLVTSVILLLRRSDFDSDLLPVARWRINGPMRWPIDRDRRSRRVVSRVRVEDQLKRETFQRKTNDFQGQ